MVQALNRFSIFAVAANSANLLAPQLVALVALKPGLFGVFSAIALIGSIFTALAFALSIDPFLRAGRDLQQKHYSSASLVYLFLSCLGGFAAGLFSLILSGPGTPWPTILAISLYPATFVLWNAQRIMLVEMVGAALKSDLIGFFVILLGLIGTSIFGLTIAKICAVAAASYGLMFLHALWRTRALWGAASCGLWFKLMKLEIRSMAFDSAMGISANSLGPLMLMPILGVSSFGVYRAVGNLAAPLRSVVTPMRSQLGRIPVSRLHSRWGGVVQISLFSSIALLVVAGLKAASRYAPPEATLVNVSSYAVVASLVVALNAFWQIYLNRGRMLLPPRALFRVRVTTSVVAAVVPLLGALVAGLAGALYALLLSTLFQSLAWWRADRSSSRLRVQTGTEAISP